MKISIEVQSKTEGEQLRAGLQDPTVRTFVCVAGVLSSLPTNGARQRVLRFIDESMAEQANTPTVLDWNQAQAAER